MIESKLNMTGSNLNSISSNPKMPISNHKRKNLKEITIISYIKRIKYLYKEIDTKNNWLPYKINTIIYNNRTDI